MALYIDRGSATSYILHKMYKHANMKAFEFNHTYLLHVLLDRMLGGLAAPSDLGR